MKICPVCRASYPGRPPRCPLDGATLDDAGPDLLGGRVVAGRYRLVERVGIGPSAEVYKTHDIRSGAVVAARVPHKEVSGAARARLHEQVRAFRLAAPHDALVPVLDVLDGAVAGRVVAITEYVSAPPLPHLLASGPVPFAAALDAGVSLASLLQHLHGRDVLARDLRAGAVFLSVSTGAAVVRVSIDALVPGPVCPPETLPAAVGVGPHHAIGYVAPERIRAEPVSPATDVYALGALLFEMVTGRPAFSGDAAEITRAHLDAPAPVLRAVDASLPRALEGLIARMMAKRAQFRPSADDVRRELEALRPTP
ncbi:MAG: serine/threonine-protein kinase [Polyangiales bacterium]